MAEAENPRAVIGDNGAINKEARDRLKSILASCRMSFWSSESAGFDVKAINDLLKMRKKEADDVINHTTLVETYCRAIGMSSYLE